MYRAFAAAAACALMLAGCNPSPGTGGPGAIEESEVSAIFDQHLPWNPESESVLKTESGIQYIVLQRGKEGGKSPIASDRVRVHYEGRRPSGEKFDSSIDRGAPAEFRLDQVIPGWTIGLQLMQEGDRFLFYIPNQLAYGDRDRGAVIKAGDDLVFLVDLLAIVEPKVSDAAAWERLTPWNPDLPEVQKTGSGLQYVILKSGDPEGASPVGGQMVVVHYEGRLAETGELFDSSYERGDPEVFPSNRLIRGWVEALALMKPGDHWMLYIPSNLGYGSAGTPGGPIPPDADLQFEVELLDVLR